MNSIQLREVGKPDQMMGEPNLGEDEWSYSKRGGHL
jgi:hypothetical protein